MENKKKNIPRRRFEGFTEDWEQRKWIDVVDISTEMVNPTSGEYDNMPHIAPGNIESFTGRILDNVKTVKEEQLISGKFRFRPDDVVYGKINPQLGKYFYATVNGLTSADAYVFNGKNGLKQKFLFAILQTSDFFKYSVSVSKRSGMPKINRDELNAYSFFMPSEEEQDKIGSYLLQLDHLITLHQRKDVFLFIKGQLGEPMNKSRENTIAWEQRKLSEVATMHARIGWQNLRTSEFLDSGDYLLVTGTDFEDGRINYATCHYVERERYEQDKNIQIENGSILITKDGTLGKVAYVQGLSMPATLNAGVFNVVIKDKKEVNGKYLFQYLKAPFLMDYVDKKATGGTIKHLNQNILVDFPIVMPCVNEQTLIGTYFEQLDNLITLHQRKDVFLFIKGQLGEPMNKSRENTIAWEQRKLGELSSSFEYGLNAAAKEYDGENKYIRITDIDDDSREFKKEDITSPDTDLSSAENYRLSEGDILFARTGASVGKSYIYKASDGLVYYAGFLIRARIKPEYNSEFVFQNTLTGDYEKFIKVTSMRSGQPGVNAQEYSQYQIMVPSKPEQDKISDCLRNLDNLITLHQRKLEKLKNIKQAYLNEMFV